MDHQRGNDAGRDVYGGGLNMKVFSEALARTGEGVESHKESMERSCRISFSLELMKAQTRLVRDGRGMRMDIPRHTWALKELTLKEYQNLVFLSYCLRKKGTIISILSNTRCAEAEMNICALYNFVDAHVTQHLWDEQSDLISITRLVAENAELCSLLWLKMTERGADRITYNELLKEPWMWGLRVSEEVKVDMMVEANVKKVCEFFTVENSMAKMKVYMSLLVDPNAFSHTKCLRDGNKQKVIPSNGDYFTKADFMRWIREHHRKILKEAGNRTDIEGAKVIRNAYRFDMLTGNSKEATVQTQITNDVMTDILIKAERAERMKGKEEGSEYDSLSSASFKEEEASEFDQEEETLAHRVAQIIMEKSLLVSEKMVKKAGTEKELDTMSACTSSTLNVGENRKEVIKVKEVKERDEVAETLKSVIESQDEWAKNSGWD